MFTGLSGAHDSDVDRIVAEQRESLLGSHFSSSQSVRIDLADPTFSFQKDPVTKPR